MLSFPKGPDMPPIPHTPDLTDAHRRLDALEAALTDAVLALATLTEQVTRLVHAIPRATQEAANG